MDLEAIAKERRLRMLKLEDGEIVIPLRGAKKVRYPSSNPHAGVWASDKWYAFLPTKQPKAIADRACAFDWCLEYSLADDCVLVFGHPNSILSLITNGPNIFRARSRKRPPEHLVAHRFVGSEAKTAAISGPVRGKKIGPAA